MSIQWISSMPDHWRKLRAKNMFTKQNRPVREQDDVVTCFRDGVVTLRKNRRTTGFTESTQWSGYQGVRKGDLVIHVMDAFAGSIGISDSDGKSTPVYSVCTPKLDINNHYYAYLLREMARTGFIQSLYRGIRERSSDFRFEVFAELFLPLPPRDEQDQIVRYLNWKVSQINKLINAKRRQIVLLQEQKQAVVNEAVTRGGIGWQEQSLGNLGSFRKGFGGSRADDSQNGVACIRYGDIYRTGVLSLTEPITRINKQAAESYARVYRNEMLFALSGETKEEIGQVLVNSINEDTWCSGDAAIFKANKDVMPQFLVFALRCPGIVMQRASLAKGDIIVHISTSALRRLRIFLPPIEEQEAIATYLCEQCNRIDKLIEKLDNEIFLFTEYRARLISDVITGKLDVHSVVVPMYEALEENVVVDESIDDVDEGEKDTSPTKIIELPQMGDTTKGHNQYFDDAIMIAGIVNAFYHERYPLGRKKLQKLLYLLRRHQQESTSAFKKKAAGPYADEVRYKGGEPIAERNKYIVTTTVRGKGTTFAKGEKIPQALEYIEKWNELSDIQWLVDKFHYTKVDNLELLATVDMAICDLNDAGISVTLASIRHLIATSEEWKAKLKKQAFSDAMITKAIDDLRDLL